MYLIMVSSLTHGSPSIRATAMMCTSPYTSSQTKVADSRSCTCAAMHMLHTSLEIKKHTCCQGIDIVSPGSIHALGGQMTSLQVLWLLPACRRY